MLYTKILVISFALGMVGIYSSFDTAMASNSTEDFRQETLNPNVTDVNATEDFRQETLNPNVTDVNATEDFRQETLNPEISNSTS